ncbi:MAG: hypothetical protein PHX04_05485 [Bacilli bacterium]|nr:hypothetical protein [Bacilli bacterium]
MRTLLYHYCNYENDNFTEYHLRFADIESAMNEDLQVRELMEEEDD